MALSIGALRGLERWGAKEMVNAAFRGFKALPASAIVTPYTARPWQDVLEIDQDATLDEINTAYRRRARQVHPDAGGSQQEFETLTRAYDQAKKLRESK
ncbi:DnaJ domain-containing protein [Rhodococcus qingshengii]|uniref:DnaJ domain-containing protein n=1 Tax=Rhodococcus qingshengii TaxID=334542 RepID=UPI001C5DC913|nr:DnaJ domain-containing protein [Rhodococcus qingshengii]